ncbi:MAG: hypothetical protein ACFBSC_10715 [Microcoleaceae cyanobacterium]
MRRNRLWLIRIGVLTACLLIGLSAFVDRIAFHSTSAPLVRIPTVGMPVAAQQPSPSPAQSPVVKPSPSPESKPTETKPATESKPTPEPAASPTPTASPATEPAEPAESAPPSAPPVSLLPLSESNYQDPQGKFKLGILEGYTVSAAGNVPLIESPDGSLAYTALTKLRESDRELPASSLAQLAIETFERGEGFVPGNYQVTGPQEIRLLWQGSLKGSQGTQPITGSILVRQQEQKVLILLISATDAAKEQVEAAVITLAETLTSVD